MTQIGTRYGRCPRCHSRNIDFMYYGRDVESGEWYTAYHKAECEDCGARFGYAEEYVYTSWHTYELESGNELESGP